MSEMTKELASEIGMAAGDRNMKAAGRNLWNEEDYGVASRVFKKLFDPTLEEEPMAYRPAPILATNNISDFPNLRLRPGAIIPADKHDVVPISRPKSYTSTLQDDSPRLGILTAAIVAEEVFSSSSSYDSGSSSFDSGPSGGGGGGFSGFDGGSSDGGGASGDY